MNKYYRYVSLVLVAAFLIFQGCSDDSTKSKKVNEFKLAAELGNTFLDGGLKIITGTDLYTGLQSNADNYYMIDLRTAADFASGHIDGAINMTAGNVTENLSTIPTDKDIILICYSGQTASQVASYLNIIGYEAYVLKFGMCGWTTDPTVNGTDKWSALTPTDATLNVTNNDITAAPVQEYPELGNSNDDAVEVVKTNMDTYLTAGTKNKGISTVWADIANYFIIDLRSEASYAAGHISGAYRVAMADLGYDENLKYLPADQPILVVCYTGHTASHVTSYLNMLGYEAYNILYGMKSITFDTNISGSNYTAPAVNLPVVIGN